MKYIDAERLKKEAKRLERAANKAALDCADSETRKFHEGKALAYQFVGILVDSLQQDQPEFPTTDEQVKEFLAAHPKIKVPEKYKNPDWLFKKQEHPDVHYTKRNELFDKCVENCNPKVMQEVSDNVDKLKSISTPAEEDWFKVAEEWEKEDEMGKKGKVHDLKILPEYFRAVKSGEKTFEVRFNDRNFQKGDVLHLREWDGNGYTGESIFVEVSYTLNDPGYCKEGYVIMAISKKEDKK